MANTIEQKALNGHGLRELVRKLNRGFVKKAELSSYVQKGDTYSKFEINNIFTKKTDTPSMPDMSNYALKSDIPKSVDMSNYVSKNGLEDLIKKIVKDEDTVKPPDIPTPVTPEIHENPDQPLPPDIHIPEIPSNTTPDFITDLNHNVIREYNLDKAEKLVFPVTIKNLEIGCFSNCKNITDITLLGVKKISDNCFDSQETIQKIFAPICFIIGDNAFSRCTALKEALFPEVLQITEDTFRYCASLEKISLPKCQSIEHWGVNGCFAYCTSLKKVSLSKCQQISKVAFNGCIALREASFPELLKTEQNIFAGCTAIEKVYMPKIKYIDKNLFWDTPKSLKELVVSEECNIKTIVKNDLLVASPCIIYNSDKSKIYNKKEYKWEPAH